MDVESILGPGAFDFGAEQLSTSAIDLSVFGESEMKVDGSQGGPALESLDDFIESLGDDSLVGLAADPASPPQHVPATPPEEVLAAPDSPASAPDRMVVDPPPASSVAHRTDVKRERSPPSGVVPQLQLGVPAGAGLVRDPSPPRAVEVPQTATRTTHPLPLQPQHTSVGGPPAASATTVVASHAVVAHPAAVPGHAVLLPSGYHQLPPGMMPVYTVPRQDQLVKKARRMQKNRESAAVSRQKKKQHLQTLERSVHVLAADKENLSRRVKELEAENESLKDEVRGLRERLGPATPPRRTSSVLTPARLMACLLCVGLVSMSHGPAYAPAAREVVALRSAAPGRTLKSVGDTVSRLEGGGARRPPPLVTSADTRQPSLNRAGRREAADPADAASDGGWLLEHQRWIAQHLNLSSGGSPTANDVDTGTDLVAVSPGGGVARQRSSEPPVLRLGTSYGPALFEAVRRRPDHSYVFCTEVQMIAAEEPSADGVPRMSLVMPTPATTTAAPTKNGSLPAVNLLQVDCNVERSRFVTVGYRNGTVTE